MHIEKNVFDNVIYSFLNDKYKSKDHVNTQNDLHDMGIRRNIWPDENENCWLGAVAIPVNKRLAFLKTLKGLCAGWLLK